MKLANDDADDIYDSEHRLNFKMTSLEKVEIHFDTIINIRNYFTLLSI